MLLILNIVILSSRSSFVPADTRVVLITYNRDMKCCLTTFCEFVLFLQDSDSDDDMNNPKQDDLPEGWEQRTDPDTGRCLDHTGIAVDSLSHVPLCLCFVVI